MDVFTSVAKPSTLFMSPAGILETALGPEESIFTPHNLAPSDIYNHLGLVTPPGDIDLDYLWHK